jgi:Uma2 family endonuclease
MASNPVSKLTEEQYLAIERAAEFRSEFLNGEMFAMAGGTQQHNRLQGNLFTEIHMLLRGTPCEVFSSDQRLKVLSSGFYTYPDLCVVCGPRDPANDYKDVIVDPIVICEVLSPSTEVYDRGLKFQRYRTIESLKDYILVDQNKMRIEQFTRQQGDLWTFRDYQRPDEGLTIDSISVSIPLHLIYDRTELS